MRGQPQENKRSSPSSTRSLASPVAGWAPSWLKWQKTRLQRRLSRTLRRASSTEAMSPQLLPVEAAMMVLTAAVVARALTGAIERRIWLGEQLAQLVERCLTQHPPPLGQRRRKDLMCLLLTSRSSSHPSAGSPAGSSESDIGVSLLRLQLSTAAAENSSKHL